MDNPGPIVAPAAATRFDVWRWLRVSPAILLVALATCFFVVRNVHGWTFLPFGDEAGHLLGALALHHGDILYRDYIDAHGPVVFMLTQFYGAVAGWHDLTYARLISSVLAFVGGLCVIFSPALRGVLPRLWAAALYFGLLAVVWVLQALYMDNYHSIAGAFVVIGLAVFVVPAWIGRASGAGAFICGVCFALTAFSAYSYAPGVVVLALSAMVPDAGIWVSGAGGAAFRRMGLTLLGGAMAGSAAVLIWLAVFGDVVGFAVFHIVGNQVYYAHYLWFAWTNFVRSFYPPVGPATLVHLMAVACFALALGIYLAAVARWSRAGVASAAGVLVGFGGIALLNARGSAIFQDGTFLMAAIGAACLAVPYALGRLELSRGLAWAWAATGLVGLVIMGAELTGRDAVATPSGYTRAQIVAVPPYHYGVEDNAVMDEIRRVVRPDERILVLVYDPIVPLSAGRLPMLKYHEYLPWEADYAKAPWFGRDRDLCVDLERAPPPLVYFDDWKVWGVYAPETFVPCLLPILATMYQREARFPTLYVRRDRAGR